MKFGDLLIKLDQAFQKTVAAVAGNSSPSETAIAQLSLGASVTTLSCYLRDTPQTEIYTMMFEFMDFVRMASENITGRDPHEWISEIMQTAAQRGIFSEETAKQETAARLLTQAGRELAENGFVDFDYAGHGYNTLVLKGVKEDGSIRAIRLTTGGSSRVESIAVLEAEKTLRLMRGQLIEITPFAEETYPKAGEQIDPRTRQLWNERVIYLLALMDYEGKHAWADAKPENIGLFHGGQPYISDPALRDPLDENVLPAKYNVSQIRKIINNGQVEFHPDGQSVFITEFFCGIRTDNRQTLARIRALAETNHWHALRISGNAGSTSLTLLVDPSRQNNGLELGKAMRDHLHVAALRVAKKLLH